MKLRFIRKTFFYSILFLSVSCSTFSFKAQKNDKISSRKIATSNEYSSSPSNIHCKIKLEDQKNRKVSYLPPIFDGQIFVDGVNPRRLFLIKGDEILHIGQGASSAEKPEEFFYIKTRNNERARYIDISLNNNGEFLIVSNGLFDLLKFEFDGVKSKVVGSADSVVSFSDYENFFQITCYPTDYQMNTP